MEKAITYVGNSFALILDRTMVEVIGVGHGSIVDISFEGDRLVIRRTGKMKPVAPRIRRTQSLGTVPDPKQPLLTLDYDENGEVSLKALARDHRTAVQHLVRRFNLDETTMRALDPRTPAPFMRALMHLCGVLERKSLTPEDIVSARRVRYCIESPDELDWKRVSAMAAAFYPWPAKSDAMSGGKGAVAETSPPSG